MPQNFIECDREQELLLPPSLREWLADDHLAWFVADAVEEMDLAAFYGAYRCDGWGRAAFEPKVMVSLLLYAYASASAPPAASNGAAARTSPSASFAPTGSPTTPRSPAFALATSRRWPRPSSRSSPSARRLGSSRSAWLRSTAACSPATPPGRDPQLRVDPRRGRAHTLRGRRHGRA